MRKSKIIGYTVVGKGEADKYLRRTLEDKQRLVDDILAVANDADDKTIELLDEFNCKIVGDNREWGKHQWKIKEDNLRKYMPAMSPNWVLTFDADEVYSPRVTRDRLVQLQTDNDIAWRFWVVELWGDENHYRKDWLFDKATYFKWDDEISMSFARKPVHCGTVPKAFAVGSSLSNHYFLHYGLMNKPDREEKVERYDKYDPEGKHLSRDWYKGLTSEGAQMEEFSHGEFIKELDEESPPTFRDSPPNIKNSMPTYVRVKRKEDGFTYTVKKEQAKHHARMEGHEILGEVETGDSMTEEVEIPEEVKEIKEENGDNICDVCGKVLKNAKGVEIHKRQVHEG